MVVQPLSLVLLVTALADPLRRSEAAAALAGRLGAEQLLIFVPDPETGTPLPALGLPQVLPRKRLWQAFLAECLRSGRAAGALPLADGAVRPALGLAAEDGTILVLLGGAPLPDAASEVLELLPLLGAVLRAERRAHAAEGQAAAARQAALDAETFATALETAQTRYRAVFEGVADAILIADAEGRYLDANPRASELLGYTRDELLQLRVADVVAAAPAWTEAEYARMKAQGCWAGELDLRRKDGSLVPVEARATAVALPAGTIYLSAIRDITERRAVERMQREFLSMVTHELRNPVTSIRGYAQLMMRRGRYVEGAAEVMVTQAKRLERIIDDLLDVSRLEAGGLQLHREPVDLVALVRAAAEQAQALTRAHSVRVEAPDGPLVGQWDATRLQQVLHNLLSNAIKYSPDGGPIVVRVAAAAAEAQVSVTDQGIGIAPEALPKLFSRFFRTDAARTTGVQGLGLGLHICKALVEAHGGRMWVASVPGQGSTFTFTLPFHPGEEGS
jgi:PAS domain S-box-containing protein